MHKRYLPRKAETKDAGRTAPASIDPHWKARLRLALHDVLAFSECGRRDGLTTYGHSQDGRALLELIETKGALTKATLQLALPPSEEIEAIKLGCWALLFLKALFADWADVREWLGDAVGQAADRGEPV